MGTLLGKGGGAVSNGRLQGEKSGFVSVDMGLRETFIGVCPTENQSKYVNSCLNDGTSVACTAKRNCFLQPRVQ